MIFIPMPALLLERIAYGNAGNDNLFSCHMLLNELLFQLGRRYTVQIHLWIDPELMDGKVCDYADQGNLQAVLPF